MKRIIARILCFFGFHDWQLEKSIIVKECEDLYVKTVTRKCATCPCVEIRITQAEDGDK